jgi:hypothetical protein
MMDADMNSGVVALYDEEVDRKVLGLRLAGVSIRRIGRELKLTDKQTLAALDRALPSLSPEMRIRLFREDLARLDELMIYWFGQAKTGSATGTALCIKLMERRAHLTGIDAPSHTRVEVLVEATAQSAENSTAVLLRELNRIAAEQPGEVIVEGERAAGRRAEPDPAA